MSVKDIYLAAHAAALNVFETGGNLTQPKRVQAALDAFDKTGLDALNYESFEAHFNDTLDKLRHLDGMTTPSDAASAETKRIAGNKAKILAKQAQNQANTAKAVPAPAPDAVPASQPA